MRGCTWGGLLERCQDHPLRREGEGSQAGQGEKAGPTTALSAPQEPPGDRVVFTAVSRGTELTQPFYFPPLSVATTKRV